MRCLRNTTAFRSAQKRTPGTAGDQGEENWAELLQGWLPRSYEVVTKGKIISHDGTTSPQIDVLVLKGAYPEQLLNKKLYLAAGVAAAFECKITLRASHIEEAVETCTKIKRLYPARLGTPYKELRSPIVYGLLAHSHSWKGENSTPEDNIDQRLCEADKSHASHPRYQLDMLCVADLATWYLGNMTFSPPSQIPNSTSTYPGFDPEGSPISAYFGSTKTLNRQRDQFTAIGVLISMLSIKLAWEDPSLRDFADYYRGVEMPGLGMGTMRKWLGSIIQQECSPTRGGQKSDR